MSILADSSPRCCSPRCFSIFQRSMIQSNKLPLCEILESTLIADAFEEDGIDFGFADEDVFTPAITLWAMVSQFLFKGTGRSCKAAAGRVVSLWAKRPIVSWLKTPETTVEPKLRFLPRPFARLHSDLLRRLR